MTRLIAFHARPIVNMIITARLVLSVAIQSVDPERDGREKEEEEKDEPFTNMSFGCVHKNVSIKSNGTLLPAPNLIPETFYHLVKRVG